MASKNRTFNETHGRGGGQKESERVTKDYEVRRWVLRFDFIFSPFIDASSSSSSSSSSSLDMLCARDNKNAFILVSFGDDDDDDDDGFPLFLCCHEYT